MLFTSCSGALPTLTTLSAANLTFDTALTLTGTAFSSTQCENQVLIGDFACPLTSSSPTQLVCQLGANSGLRPNYPYKVRVRVANMGYALLNDTFTLKFVPKVVSVSVSSGSTAGGTLVSIGGDGFLPQSTVIVLGQTTYYHGHYAQVNATHIQLTTQEEIAGGYSLDVRVNNVPVVLGTDKYIPYVL